jgi:tetratricopeptide (TPR) repeat protein
MERIEECCQGDSELLEVLQRMLSHRDTAEEFFALPLGYLGDTGLPFLEIGTVLCDRFRIVELVGSGGMGQVYEAEDSRSSRRVALKTLQMLRPEALTLFKNEFRSLTGVLHPNLVTLFELFVLEKQQFFTMEYIHGIDLVDYFQSRVDLNTPESYCRAVRSTLRQIVEGVDWLHRAGKIHCDLKPSNILVEEGGRVRIVDFGLVRNIRSHEGEPDSGILAGTLAYMSPEQVMGKLLSPATDWFSLGVLLYEVLTGDLPFRGSEKELLEHKNEARFAHPRELAPATTEDIADLCVELLAPAPRNRPCADRLREYLAEVPSLTARDAEAILPRDVFVGRERELGFLDAAYARLDLSESSTVFVEGASGIGKTALVEKFLSALRVREGTLIFAGKCYEQEIVPYKALDAVVDAISSHLLALPEEELAALSPENIRAAGRIFRSLSWLPAMQTQRPPEADIDDVEVRRRGVAAFRELLSRLGARQKTVIFIDDLQWGDSDSAMLLSDLLTGPGAPRILLIAAMRSGQEQTSPCIQTLVASAKGFSHLRLLVEPLDDGETQELATQLLEQLEPEARGRGPSIFRESGGNPYYLHELVRARGANLGSGGIDAMVWRAVESASDPGRKLVETVAMSGRPIFYRDACASAQIDCGDPNIMIALRALRLVRTVGSREQLRVDVYHDRVREAIVNAIPEDMQRGLHLQLARVLLRSDDRDSENIALHFDRGGDAAAASSLYLKAADGAENALAFEHAANLFDKALRLGTFGPQLRRSLRVRMGNAFSNAGRCLQAADTFEAAMEGSDVGESRVLLRQAAYNLCISGHVTRGRAMYAKLLTQVGMRLPQSPAEAIRRLLWARFRLRFRGLKAADNTNAPVREGLAQLSDVAWTAATGLGMVDVFSSAAVTTEGLLLALRSGDPLKMARFLLWESVIRGVGAEGHREAGRMLEAARHLIDRLHDPYLDGLFQLALGFQAYQSCRFREAEVLFGRAETCFRDRCRGAIWEMTTAQHQRIHALLMMGEYSAVAERLPPLLQDARDKGDLYSFTTLAVFPEALNRLRLDQPRQAIVQVSDALAQWPQEGMTFQRIQALMGVGWIRMYMGQPSQALEALREQWPELRRAHVLRGQIHRIAFLDLRCRASIASAGDHPNSKKLLAAAEQDAIRLNRESVAVGPALAAAARGSLFCFRGDRAAAVRQFEKAAGMFRELDMGVFAQSALRAAGAAGGGSRGRTMMRDSEEWIRAQGFHNPARMAEACNPLPSAVLAETQAVVS